MGEQLHAANLDMLRLEADNAALRAACGRLLRAYEAEETEHGFPFSFELRSAHQALKAHMDEDY